jgi:hypothetical protein
VREGVVHDALPKACAVRRSTAWFGFGRRERIREAEGMGTRRWQAAVQRQLSAGLRLRLAWRGSLLRRVGCPEAYRDSAFIFARSDLSRPGRNRPRLVGV